MDSLALGEGATDSLTAVVLDRHGTVVSGARVTWASTDTSVAFVSDSGTVTARQPGVARIVAAVSKAGAPLEQSVPVVVRAVPAALAVVAGPDYGRAGTVLDSPLQVRVLDRRGNGVAGQHVDFVLTKGEGSLSAPSEVTDEQGVARVLLTLGPSGGLHEIEARLRGTELLGRFTATGHAWVVLDPNPLHLRAGCEAPLRAQLTYPSGGEVLYQKVSFSVSDSATVRLAAWGGGGTESAKYGGQTRTVRGWVPGVVRVTAERDGIADTATIRIEANPQRTFRYQDLYPSAPAVGDRVTASVQYSAECGEYTPISLLAPHAEPVVFRSLDESVAVIEASGANIVRLRPLAGGKAAVEARFGTYADTLRFDVLPGT